MAGPSPYIQLPDGSFVAREVMDELSDQELELLRTAPAPAGPRELSLAEKVIGGMGQGSIDATANVLAWPGAVADIGSWMVNSLTGALNTGTRLAGGPDAPQIPQVNLRPAGLPNPARLKQLYYDLRGVEPYTEEELGIPGRTARTTTALSPMLVAPLPGSAATSAGVRMTAPRTAVPVPPSAAAARPVSPPPPTPATATPVPTLAARDVSELAGGAGALETARELGVEGVLPEIIVETLGAVVGRGAANRLTVPTQPDVPVIPDTRQGVAAGETIPEPAVRQALETVQESVRLGRQDPVAVADDIAQNLAEREAAGIQAPTTTATVADSPGISSVETVARARNPQEVAAIQLENQREALANLESVAPEQPLRPDELPRAARMDERQARLATERTVAQAEQAVEQAQRDLAGEPLLADVAPDTRLAIDEQVRAARRSVIDEKERLYANIDPSGTRVLQLDPGAPPPPVGSTVLNQGTGPKPLLDAIDQVRAASTRLSGDAAQAWRPIVEDIERFVKQGYVSVKELGALRQQLRGRIDAARASTLPVVRGELAEGLETLRRSIGETFDSLTQLPLRGPAATEARQAAEEATTFYREEYAPRFREGPGGQFEQALRGERSGRRPGAAPPSQTAERFLRPDAGIEPPQALARILEWAPNRQAADQAVRDYLVRDLLQLAQRGGSDSVNFAQLSNWRRRYGDALDQFPGVRQEVDDMIDSARTATQRVDQLTETLRMTREARDEVLREIDANPMRVFTEYENPARAAGALLNSKNPSEKLTQVMLKLQDNPEGMTALRRAVRDYLHEQVGTTRPIDGTDDALSYAKSVDRLKRYDSALRKLYSPDEMQSLNRVRNILRDQARGEQRVLAGSQTFERAAAQTAMTVLQMGLRVKFGVLKAGGMMKTARDAFNNYTRLNNVMSFDEAVKQVIDRAALDPEVAQQLLRWQEVPADPTRLVPFMTWIEQVLTGDE